MAGSNPSLLVVMACAVSTEDLILCSWPPDSRFLFGGGGLAPVGRATRLLRRPFRYSAALNLLVLGWEDDQNSNIPNSSLDIYVGPGGVTLRLRSFDRPRNISISALAAVNSVLVGLV